MKYFAGEESPSSSISTVLNTTGRRHSLQPRPPSSPRRPSLASSTVSTATPSPVNPRHPGYSSHSRSSSKQSISSSKSVNFVSTQTYQIEKLKHENEELTTKLRKTRLMLNENTSRNRVLTFVWEWNLWNFFYAWKITLRIRLRELYQKLAKSETLAKDLYLENTRLMKLIRHHFKDSHSISVL